MSPTEGRGTYCFWCGSSWCRRQRQRRRWRWRDQDSLLVKRRNDNHSSPSCLHNIMNRKVDFYLICMAVTLGHDEELIRFW